MRQCRLGAASLRRRKGRVVVTSGSAGTTRTAAPRAVVRTTGTPGAARPTAPMTARTAIVAVELLVAGPFVSVELVEQGGCSGGVA